MGNLHYFIAVLTCLWWRWSDVNPEQQGVQLPTFLQQPTFGTHRAPPRGRSLRSADVDAGREANVLSLSVLVVGAGPAGGELPQKLLRDAFFVCFCWICFEG